MTPKRFGRHLEGGAVPEDERSERARQEVLREGYSRWATGVAIVAVREGGRVHALTVSAFLPVSVSPPLVLVSLGPNASALPYLTEGARFGISILEAGQQALASRFSDTFPVGPSPFPVSGAPLIAGSLAGLECQVSEVRAAGDHHLVMARVLDVRTESNAAALGYFRRAYRTIRGEE